MHTYPAERGRLQRLRRGRREHTGERPQGGDREVGPQVCGHGAGAWRRSGPGGGLRAIQGPGPERRAAAEAHRVEGGECVREREISFSQFSLSFFCRVMSDECLFIPREGNSSLSPN